jgi:RNA polymerase sigma-70 factor (ECF subfamily)
MTAIDDAALIARCRGGGDDQAFAELVGRYRERVFRLALSILGRPFAAEAEEVTQEVFLRVHHALATFRGESQFGTWVYRIAFNQALNLKGRVRYRAPHLSDDALAARASGERGADEQLAAARRDRAVAECVAELPDVYQSALRLHYWMGETMAEIALLLGVPENTVKSYLHRARRLLQVRLEERGFVNG